MNRRGFTLLEIVVSAGLFSIVMLTATGLFVSTTRAQKRVQSLTKVQGDARFLVESIAQSVRIDGIDYTTMTPLSTSVVHGVKLITRNAIGDRTFYRMYENSGRNVIGACVRPAADTSSRCVPSSALDVTNYTDVTPANVTIITFNVAISPDSDPFLSRPNSAVDCVASPPSGFGFDPDIGACTCNAANVLTACFPDQTCGIPASASEGVCQNANEQPRATIVIASSGGSARADESTAVTFQTTVSSRLYKR